MPLSNADINIWQARHAAQIKIIEEMATTIKNGSMDEWGKRIGTTLEYLTWWSEKQFAFFFEGYKNSLLVDSRNYPIEYALSLTVNQTAYDISVLQRAYIQRQPTTKDQTSNQGLAGIRDLTGSETLALADSLAYKALQPAINTKLLENTTVITYFQKEPKVRVIPYAPLALIGIPYTCRDSDSNVQDFLAIPHEIGHHVFWHGKKNYEGLTHKPNLRALIYGELTPYPSTWYTTWVEEIFADIYSTIVAGPVSALSLQDLLYDNLKFNEDDGYHPVPRIRPKASFKALEKLGASKAAKKLETIWDDRIQKRGLQKTKRVKVQANEPDHFVQNGTAIDYIESVTDEIFNVLKDEVYQMVSDTWIKDTNQPLENLYKQFKQEILEPLKTLSTPPVPNLEKMSKEQWLEENLQVQWLNSLEAASSKGLTLEPTIWMSLLNAGWLSNGPEDDAGSK